MKIAILSQNLLTRSLFGFLSENNINKLSITFPLFKPRIPVNTFTASLRAE